jgi:hypothetical protein
MAEILQYNQPHMLRHDFEILREGRPVGAVTYEGIRHRQANAHFDGTAIQIKQAGTVEQPPFRGDDEAELRACVQAFNVGAVTITVDGKEVPLTVVETPLLNLVLPAENVLVEAEEPVPADSVGRGFVALLQPLPPGTHQIVISVSGSAIGSFTSTTTIVVQPGQSRAA